VSSDKNPFSKGTVVAGTRYVVGDSYHYRVIDLFTKLEGTPIKDTITQITDTQVIYSSGRISDLLGNLVRTRDGIEFGPAQFLPLEYSVGKRWTTRCRITTQAGTGELEMDFRIVTRESVTVPAGTFDAYRLEAQGWSIGPWGSVNSRRKLWIAPGKVRRPVAIEDYRQLTRLSKVIANEREELVSYREA
jgi:hypothetical protein